MARREPSGGRLASALGAAPERMPPDGTWPPVLREPPSSDADPPTVPLPRAAWARGGGRAGVEGSQTAASRVDDPWPDPPATRDPVAAAGTSGPGLRSRVVEAIVPAAWRGARGDPGRPGAKALSLVAALAAVAAAVGVWMDRPRSEPVAALPAVVVTESADVPTATGTAAPAADVPAAPLVLSVSGKVVRPGLIELPDGSRVADALEAAGGALPGTDLSALNLARRVVDGEQIAVGVPAAPDAAPAAGTGSAGTGSSGTGEAGGPVDLNTATEDQLDALPGVGPVTAQRILEWRERNGRFTRVEQLREIEGIGERRFGQLRELVVV